MDKINNKGWIALDIDGTVTSTLHEMPAAVALYLKELVNEGWNIVFVTGRIFSFAHHVLRCLDFPYYVAVQNGADIIEMPSRQLINNTYLAQDVLVKLDKIYTEFPEDFIIYAGYKKGDFCYFRPNHFSETMRQYLKILEKLSVESWQTFNSLSELSQLTFPLIKCFGKESEMRNIFSKLQTIPNIHATLIRDTVSRDLHLILITDKEATKGKAIDQILAKTGQKGRIIAAGDDCNDIELLDRADIKIAMETAPQELLNKADIIAPSAEKDGIIEALQKATLEARKNNSS